jgi:LysR family transcriptional regulator of gallate degradation
VLTDPKRINLRHLAAVSEVARWRSISGASRRVHLSQPAITQAIAKLEVQLGVALFDRRSQGMFPTEPGAIFLERIDRALDYLRKGARDVARLAPRRRGFERFDRLVTVAQLRALIAVTESGSFSLAARSVGLSQPTVHRAAQDLERLAGVALFDKTSRGMRPTRAGLALTRQAKLAFAEIGQGLAEISAWRGADSGCIVVGALPLARTYIFPRAITRLMADNPMIGVRIVEGPYDDLLHGLRHGDIDLLMGALRTPTPIEDVVQEPLFDDPLAIVVRAGHPLTAERRLTAAKLARYEWVIPRPSTPMRTRFDLLFRSAGLTPPVNPIECSSLIAVRGLLLESDRVTILSAHQILHEARAGLLRALPFPLRGAGRTIGITTRRDWRPTATQRKLLDLIRETSAELSKNRLKGRTGAA